MKPLPSAPLTDEDQSIWAGLHWRDDRVWHRLAYEMRLVADRRDAELMHHCTYCRDLPRLERWRGFAVAHVIQRGDCERFAWKV